MVYQRVAKKVIASAHVGPKAHRLGICAFLKGIKLDYAKISIGGLEIYVLLKLIIIT